jgi:hypothetical protein
LFVSLADGFQPHAAAAASAHATIVDQFDATRFQRRDQLHQRVDVATNHILARLHPLNGRHREAAKVGQLALINAEQRPCGAQLRGGDHGGPFDVIRRYDMRCL